MTAQPTQPESGNNGGPKRNQATGTAVLGKLKGWPDETKDLVRIALERPGVTARRTATNHVRLLNEKTGTTVVISGGDRARGSSTYENNRALVRKLLDDPTVASGYTPPAEKPKAPNRQEARANAIAALAEFKCGLCGNQLLNLQALEDHRKSAHVRCDWVDPLTGKACEQWIKSEKGVGPHKSIAHGKNKPWLAKGSYALPGHPPTNKKKDPEPVHTTTPESRGLPMGPPQIAPDRSTLFMAPTNTTTTSPRVKVPVEPPRNRRVVDAPLPDKPVEKVLVGDQVSDRAAVINEAIDQANDRARFFRQLQAIQEVLGKEFLIEDSRVAELQEENKLLREKLAEMETRFELMTEGIERAREAARI